MKLICYDDITGDGTKQQLIGLLKVGGVAVSQKNWDTKYFQLQMLSPAGLTRVGDSNVSATNGIEIGTSPANGQFVPPIAFATDKYELSDIYIIIANGDKLQVARWA